MADLSVYKVNLDTPQPNGRLGESPRSAFTKYNDSLDAIGQAVRYVGETPPDDPYPGQEWEQPSAGWVWRRNDTNDAWLPWLRTRGETVNSPNSAPGTAYLGRNILYGGRLLGWTPDDPLDPYGAGGYAPCSIKVYSADKIPLANEGPIFVPGMGVMTWSSGQGRYQRESAHYFSHRVNTGVPISSWQSVQLTPTRIDAPLIFDPTHWYIASNEPGFLKLALSIDGSSFSGGGFSGGGILIRVFRDFSTEVARGSGACPSGYSFVGASLNLTVPVGNTGDVYQIQQYTYAAGSPTLTVNASGTFFR